MTPESVMGLGFQAVKVALSIAAPLLLGSMFTGLVVSILQASTQINESTLSFIPKILTIVVVMIVLGPWMMGTLMDYMRTVFTAIPEMIR
ncbi:flagellar biosynthetic protein FliQ [Enterobacter sp. BIGb0383]|uniref:flagellar biosynthesis protein FliQ n=1 Tax=unclassified Enterobacter TaxID=2608935 RepID=UPI000F4744B9|nr:MULTISPECIES: flagellar biosynthesis protein FliQ [unclassified Enterobacter]ROP58339.1 flagellar biosynthetic protein FliQ [Enterobacter sp. BIGb0383]ROS06773.1 flagellar biosynthetic protein FliQ [Enterobacter sp. BIGb0359]